jgi:FMN phosphatase YigB (HAD superfamily)
MLFEVTFDLDGVLADTREAVHEAYAYAGVDMPIGAWGKPAGSWLQDPRRHHLKQKIYPDMLAKYARRLTGADVAEILRAERVRVGVVTNASMGSALAVLRFLDLEVDGLLCANKLVDLALLGPRVHVDDDELPQVCPLIHFQGESIDDLLRMVKDRL